MKAVVHVYCDQDLKYLGEVTVDTADMPDDLQRKVNRVILLHRPDCRYYSARPAVDRQWPRTWLRRWRSRNED